MFLLDCSLGEIVFAMSVFQIDLLRKRNVPLPCVSAMVLILACLLGPWVLEDTLSDAWHHQGIGGASMGSREVQHSTLYSALKAGASLNMLAQDPLPHRDLRPQTLLQSPGVRAKVCNVLHCPLGEEAQTCPSVCGLYLA